MEQSATSEIDLLKAAEKGKDEGDRAQIRDKSGKRNKRDGRQKRRKGERPCEWEANSAVWGLLIVAGGVTALLATAGYPLNLWALFLAIPGLVGLAHSARLARRFPEADWTVWPLTSTAGMTAGGLAWLLGLSWTALAGSLLLALGLALLWLVRVGARAQTVK